MSIKTDRPTITTTAVDLSGTDDARPGSTVDVLVMSGSTIYVGGPDVTAATGRPVAAGSSYALDLTPGDRLFAVTASGSAEVSVLWAGA